MIFSFRKVIEKSPDLFLHLTHDKRIVFFQYAHFEYGITVFPFVYLHEVRFVVRAYDDVHVVLYLAGIFPFLLHQHVWIGRPVLYLFLYFRPLFTHEGFLYTYNQFIGIYA